MRVFLLLQIFKSYANHYFVKKKKIAINYLYC